MTSWTCPRMPVLGQMPHVMAQARYPMMAIAYREVRNCQGIDMTEELWNELEAVFG